MSDYDTVGHRILVFPELFTLAMFPNISDNEQAINVGIALRKIWASAASHWMLLFWCQTSSKTTAQRLCSVAHSVLV